MLPNQAELRRFNKTVLIKIVTGYIQIFHEQHYRFIRDERQWLAKLVPSKIINISAAARRIGSFPMVCCVFI